VRDRAGDPSGTAGAARATVVGLMIAGGLELIAGSLLLVEAWAVRGQVDDFRRERIPPLLVVTVVALIAVAVAYVVAGVLWLRWQHRSSAVLWRRGAYHVTISPGWGVAWWFIPYAQFVMPLIVLFQIDRAARTGVSPPLPRSTGLLWVWWGLYEGSDIVAGLAWAVAAAQVPTGPALTDAEAVSITAGFCAAFGAKLLLQGASAAPAIAIVRRIQEGLGRFVASMVPPRPDGAPLLG
jgi:hypothetical protein